MRLTKAFLATCLMSSVAAADNETPVTTTPPAATATATTTVAAAPAEPVSPAGYYGQPAGAPATPAVSADVVEQAGVGSTVGYGRAGVLELGGSAGLTMAQDIRAINFSPSIGWFLTDNFELSGILDVANFKAGESSATIWSALAEPSFHLPFNNQMFGFVGMGVGAAYVSQLGSGLSVAPRVGMDFLVGRSGILRPSLSYQYTTHDAMSAADSNGNTDVTLVSVSSALRFNIGYSTMW